MFEYRIQFWWNLVLDFGASQHMTPHKELFYDYKTFTSLGWLYIQWATNKP
jgi:hypothetical protein